jgi:hypothetical protein
MVKDSAKKLGKFVVCTWDGIYLGPDEGVMIIASMIHRQSGSITAVMYSF